MVISLRQIFVGIFVVILVGASFAVGFSFGKKQGIIIPIEGVMNISQGKPEGIDFSLFWQAWNAVQDKFAQPEKLDYQKMVYGAISGMVQSLGDPYTIFMDPEEARRFKEDISGIFEGIGMEIGIRENELRVIAPIEGTPAQKAGVRAGDKILKIDDTFTKDLTVEEAVLLIRGPKETIVTLSIFREGWKEPRDFKIERAVIQIPSLRWELKEGTIAYIKLFHFSEKANRDFQRIADEILASPAQKIILDLRNNPGGFLEVSRDIAGWFLNRGDVVVIEDFGPDQEQQKYKAQGNVRFLTYPMVMLINEGSASASEILAGALRDNRGVSLIGTKSFGKGSVQEVEEFRDASSLKITVANWLTPKGDLITDKGLEPDIEVEMTNEDFDKGLDPQLDKAIEVVKGL